MPAFIPLTLLLAGFIIGLGAVTVIDWHGFLARKSPYWAEDTIRTHKVTKPLIWLGMILATFGGILLYWGQPLAGVPLYHLVAAVVLVLNGSFLSFVVSPELIAREKAGKARELLPVGLQAKIAASFVVSFVGWWSSIIMLAWYLTQ